MTNITPVPPYERYSYHNYAAMAVGIVLIVFGILSLTFRIESPKSATITTINFVIHCIGAAMIVAGIPLLFLKKKDPVRSADNAFLNPWTGRCLLAEDYYCLGGCKTCNYSGAYIGRMNDQATEDKQRLAPMPLMSVNCKGRGKLIEVDHKTEKIEETKDSENSADHNQ
jgi:hypothetical protein